MRFGDGEQDGVVERLGAAVEDAEGAAGVEGGGGDGLQEHAFADVVGAGAGDEHAAAVEQAEGAEIDVLIAGERFLHGAAGFREGGRVEDDGVEAAVGLGVLCEELEDVGFAPLDVVDFVGGGVFPGAVEGGRGGIESFDAIGAAGEVEGEAAGGTETVEDLAAREALGGEVVLALVEEGAGFLAAEEIDVPVEAVELDLVRGREFAVDELFFEREAFEFADGDVVAEDDGAGLEEGFQRVEDGGACGVHALVEELDGEGVTVAVDDEGGQTVGFGVDEPVGIARGDALAVGEGGGKALVVEGGVDDGAGVGEAAEGDLGAGAEMEDAQVLGARVEDFDGGAGRGVAGIDEVALKDPRVAVADSVGGLTVHTDDIQTTSVSPNFGGEHRESKYP